MTRSSGGNQQTSTAGEIISLWMVSFFVFAIVGGIIAFRQGWAVERGNEMSFDRAMFTVVNAVTLTGFEQRASVDRYKFDGQLVVFGLTIVGSLFSLVVGGLAVVRMLGLRYTIGQVIRAAIAWELAMVLIGAGALTAAGGSDSHFAAWFHAASAFGNSGLVLGSIGDAMDWRTQIIFLPLAVLGGLGLPVLMELFDAARRRASLSTHSRTVLGMSAFVYVGGAALLLAVFWLTSDRGYFNSPRASIASCAAAALNARSLGFPLHPELLASRPVQWIIVLLMIVGASPAGTGGGIKTTTLAVIGRNVTDALRRRTAGRAFGLAMVWVGIYALIVLIAFIGLLSFEPQMPADRLMFLTVSAASNVGLSHDPVSITGPGLYVMCATMMLGRLAPLWMLWWAARTTDGIEIATA